MVHEPYLEFRRGPLRHAVMACVHRLMTMVLLERRQQGVDVDSRVGASLRPYTLGRTLPMQWLPVPGCVADESSASAAAIRLKYAADGQPLLGHFGSYGAAVTALLDERLPPLMDGAFKPSLLLLGSGSQRFCRVLLEQHPSWSRRVHAAGYLSPAELSAHIAACDVFVQPYPDGITSRRTSTMACLSRARPVVTTTGHLTEPLWAETGAVALADVDDSDSFTSAVIGSPWSRRCASRTGMRGQRVYVERFSVTRFVDALRAA